MKRELLERMDEFRKNEEETLKRSAEHVKLDAQLNKLKGNSFTETKNDKTVSVSEYVSEDNKEETQAPIVEQQKIPSTDNALNQQRKNISLPLETYIKLNEIKYHRFNTEQEFISLTSLVKRLIDIEHERLGLTTKNETE